jgi:predicted helicase
LSQHLINEYRAELDRLRAVSGSRRESVLREAFKDLLKRWGKAHDLQFIAEHDILTKQMTRIYVDGALLHGLRVPFGYWEAKDESDDLDKEIEAKFRKGYPRDNIVFTDDARAVLWQDGAEVMRADMQADNDSLLRLLTRFFAHERQEIADFNKAVKQFAADLPEILRALRERIDAKQNGSAGFARALADFLQHARDAINPAVSEDDVREMLIQHILTEDIFAKVFDDPDYHRKNNVAAELYKLEDKLFSRGEKASLLKDLAPYYTGIASTAALIRSHSEKQGFLKALYEDFYKAYNKKAADRLGVVYTPGEIVRFMIRSADWLCEKHFGRNLIDRGVEILDPATGTGTFIVELLEHFRGNHDKLRHKYKEELHANEVAILPYYVANLNIEATYQAITGQFAEYGNLCLVDTLDNVDALGIHAGHQFDLLGSLTDENIERIKRQNRRKISVIIGNPPYNANQQNENDNNKNRTYAHIDKRIKDTYIKASTAQKTKLYDMYARFYRWASDRLGDEGLVAFVSNNSFLEAKTFDGFRKCVERDFSEAWVIDLKGNARTSGDRRRREGGNIFEDKIKVGVAIAFFVRRRDRSQFVVNYLAVDDFVREDDKRDFVAQRDLRSDRFTKIKPTPKGDWLNQTDDTVWQTFLPLASKEQKAREYRAARAICHQFANGVNTARDSWAIDPSEDGLADKVEWFLARYESVPSKADYLPNDIKWSRNLKNKLKRGLREGFSADQIQRYAYRPYHDEWYYRSRVLIDELGAEATFGVGSNKRLAISAGLDFRVLATRKAVDFHYLGETRVLARYRYTKSGERVDNITDWALNKFVAEYGGKGVTKDSVFHYVYAVLHDPVYRETYALNLKREFPRIPFYPDFAQWAAWGEALMALHIGYEDVAPWPVERIGTPDPRRAKGTQPKPVLKSHPDKGLVVVDADTQITGIPRAAWDYRLGNRSAIDWVLDQHREKKPRDPTIRAKFNTYRFADYKESMIELLARVVRVSVETVAITEKMAAVQNRNA